MSKRKSRQQDNRRGLLSPEQFEPRQVPVRADRKPLTPMNDRQAEYLNAIKTSTLTFGTGPAGTGKTYIAAAFAADAIRERQATRLIITRPAVEAGENLGFLPGELEEKFDPYFAPVRSILIERLGSGHVEAMIKSKRIEVAPLAYLRGATFKDAVVILDEAQNTTPVQMKLFLTRIGERAKIIVNGDLKQKDIAGKSGLLDAIERVRHLHSVSLVRFQKDDIVRSGLVREIVDAYENDDDEDDGLFEVPAFMER